MTDTNVLIIIAVFAFVVVPILVQMSRAKKYKKFFRVLWKDQEARMESTLTPMSVFPNNLEESLEMFYPELPSLDQCMKTSPQKLVEMVEWSIDPRQFGLKIAEKRMKHREIQRNRPQRRRKERKSTKGNSTK